MNLLQRYSRTLIASDRARPEAAHKDTSTPPTWRGQFLTVGLSDGDWEEESVASEATPSEPAIDRLYQG